MTLRTDSSVRPPRHHVLPPAVSLPLLTHSLTHPPTYNTQVFKVGQRIANCMAKLFSGRKHFAAAANATLLARSLKQRMWQDTAVPIRQLPNIGKLISQRLGAAGLGSFGALAAADPRRIEAVAQRNYPFGNQVRVGHVTQLPILAAAAGDHNHQVMNRVKMCCRACLRLGLRPRTPDDCPPNRPA